MTEAQDKSARRSIALIGYRGAGKTVVARAIASITGVDFVDTDDVVVARAGRSIAEIFAEEGEAVFRRYEAEAIADLLKNPPGVVSVGGGAVMDAESVRLLRGACLVVWLTAPVEVLWQRIRTDGGSASGRPSLTERGGLDEVRSVLAAREERYRAAAHATVETNGRTPQRVAEDIVALAKGFQPE